MSPSSPRVVALIPAKNSSDRIRPTVEALVELDLVDRVLVIDDGSTDATAERAFDAGADVLALGRNSGKGDAIQSGIESTPDADIYLLIDADLAETAAAADLLLGPVLADEADLVVGVLPSADGRGGGGRVKRFAGRSIKRATGVEVREPLSGQRAVRRRYVETLPDSSRFGLEVAMTIDALRAGARFQEIDVPMDHRHTGRSWRGLMHRAGQGRDIIRALIPRLTSFRLRVGFGCFLLLSLLAGGLFVSAKTEPNTLPPAEPSKKVIVFAMNPMGFSDINTVRTPNLERAIGEGAFGAMSVRTTGRNPTLAEGYLSLGQGFG